MREMKWGFTLALLTSLTVNVAPVIGGEFGLFGAYWDTEDAGDSAGVAIRYVHPLAEHWALDARWYWYFDVSSTDAYSIEPSFISIGPAYLGHLAESMQWYLSGAVSAWWVEQEENEENEEQIYDYGFLAVGGVKWDLSESWALFADVQYIWVRPELEVGQVGSGIKEDATLDGPGANLGVSFRW
jgi:hypothetical protein